jgi:penicillin amidase
MKHNVAKLCRSLFMFLTFCFFALEIQAADILVYRDPYGVPHIVASTTEDAFFGYGYCLARDRLFQLEVLRRSVQGRLAEVFGRSFLDADFLARRDGVSAEELAREYEVAPPAFRRVVRAFASGINHAIDRFRRGILPLEAGFKKYQIQPVPFAELDILELFAGTMAVRYNDFSQELDNLHFLGRMVRKMGAREASRIFEDVIFFRAPQVYGTLEDAPELPIQIRSIPHLPHNIPDTRNLHSPTLRNRKRNQTLNSVGIPEKSGSYAVVASNLRHGLPEAFLLGGPQMGYFTPSALYEVGLHTPEFDLVGTTPVGYVAILFGANRRIGFTATAGVGNLVDILALTPTKDQPGHLSGHRFETPTNRRCEVFQVKGQTQPVTREIVETPHGPVIAVEGQTHFVKNRGWKGHVIDSYVAWFEANYVETLAQYRECATRMSLSINWLGADREGHICFVHCGSGKSRRSFGDDRLPTGSPSAFRYPDVRVEGQDPKTGFYANWNSPPTSFFRNGDMQAGWGNDQRTRFMADFLRTASGSMTLEHLRELDRRIAFLDLRAWFYRDLLCSFIDATALSAHDQTALVALREWDLGRRDDNNDGLYDAPGAHLFEKFWANVFRVLFADTLGDFSWMISSDPTWTQSSILAEALQGKTRFDFLNRRPAKELVTSCFQETVAGLASEGQPLPLLPIVRMEFVGVNHVNAPTNAPVASCTPFMNRGSDIQLLHLNRDHIQIWGVMPPGNAALGKHQTSQMPLFRKLRYRERPLLKKDIELFRVFDTLRYRKEPSE